MNEASMLTEVKGGIGWITLNRPPLNVFTTQMCVEMLAALNRFDADPNVRLIVFAANGERAFSAGADIGEHDEARMAELSTAVFNLMKALINPAGKLRIAAAQGICAGGGVELAFACDIVVARDDAHFSMPEVHLGLANSLAALCLARTMSQSKALELAMTGDRISAREALGLGMITQVFPVESFRADLDKYLERFTAKSGPALHSGRTFMRRVFEMKAEEGLDYLHREMPAEALTRHDYHEGIAAYLEKRKPRWTHS
ncbi:MAG: enoyl-CoA hydratase/isomerase family protein [Hyphomonadaceae bacterium]